jgi:hypothetical protein
MSSSTCVGCGSNGREDVRGTFLIDKQTSFSFEYLNFSDCRLPSESTHNDHPIGFLFYVFKNTITPWSFRFGTVLKCSGSSGIHHNELSSGTVESCNFYDNVARNDLGIIACQKAGVAVRDCIFERNSREIFLYSGASRFSVNGCVFSSPLGSLPSAYFDDSSSGNFFGTTTASHAILHVHREYCATSTPTATPAPTPTPSRTCQSYMGVHAAAISLKDTLTCVLITDSFFGDITGTSSRGAVTLDTNAGPLFAHFDTFLRCTAPGGNSGGGAIYVTDSDLEVDECCFVETEADSHGNAIFTDGKGTVNRIHNSNFGNCGTSSSASDASICFWWALTITFDLLNFSDCKLMSTDSAKGLGILFYAQDQGQYAWAVRYCTVLQCSGADAIHSSGIVEGIVEYCNFYSNSVSRAVLYGYKGAFTARSCIFKGSARDFFLDTSSTTIFQIIACVFAAASFPNDGNFRADLSGNRLNTETASLDIPVLSSQDCRAAVTRSPTPTPTSRFSESSAMTRSSQPAESNELSASSSLADSQLPPSAKIPHTSLPLSANLRPSALALTGQFPVSVLTLDSLAIIASQAFESARVAPSNLLPDSGFIEPSFPLLRSPDGFVPTAPMSASPLWTISLIIGATESLRSSGSFTPIPATWATPLTATSTYQDSSVLTASAGDQFGASPLIKNSLLPLSFALPASSFFGASNPADDSQGFTGSADYAVTVVVSGSYRLDSSQALPATSIANSVGFPLSNAHEQSALFSFSIVLLNSGPVGETVLPDSNGLLTSGSFAPTEPSTATDAQPASDSSTASSNSESRQPSADLSTAAPGSESSQSSADLSTVLSSSESSAIPSADESSQLSTVSSNDENGAPVTATSGSRSVSRARATSSPVPPLPATAAPRTRTDTRSEISLNVAGGSGGNPGGETSVGLVVGIVLGLLFLIAGLVIFLIFLRRRASTEGCPNEYEIETEHTTASGTVEYLEAEVTTFDEVFDNPLSAAGVSEDSGGVFMVVPEEGAY